jgi:hypothetical protein
MYGPLNVKFATFSKDVLSPRMRTAVLLRAEYGSACEKRLREKYILSSKTYNIMPTLRRFEKSWKILETLERSKKAPHSDSEHRQLDLIKISFMA